MHLRHRQQRLDRALAIIDETIGAIQKELQGVDVENFCDVECNRRFGTLQHELVAKFGRVAPVWKHDGFVEEHEWRLVYEPKGDEDPGIKFRTGRTAIIPYVELKFHDQGASHPSTDRIEVLNELSVGPSPEPGLAMSTMAHLLRVNRLACSKYSLSNIPYRHW